MSLRSGRFPGHAHGDQGGHEQLAQIDPAATAPPQGPESRERIPPAARTRPRSPPGDPVRSRTSRPMAVCCRKLRLAETTWPPKYRRKSRDRRARNELPALTAGHRSRRTVLPVSDNSGPGDRAVAGRRFSGLAFAFTRLDRSVPGEVDRNHELARQTFVCSGAAAGND
jgi:hypothetical protein